MGLMNGKTSRLSRKAKIIISIIIGFIVLVLGISVLTNLPKADLGPKLNYIGKEDYGCLPFPFFFVCDSPTGSVYYFATDMSKEELKRYFTKAQFRDNPNSLGGGGSVSNFEYLDFVPREGGDTIVIAFYDNPQAVIKMRNLRDTSQKNVISISDEDYDLAKNAL